MELVISTADLRDAEGILKLQFLCYQSEAEIYDDYAIPPLIQSLENLLAEYGTHRIFVAKLGDEVVGSVRGVLEDGTCRIGRLIVHPRFQGRGLGTRLMREIEADFDGVARHELFTGHRSEGNLRLYERLGYREFRREDVSPKLRLVYLEKSNV